MNQTIEFHQVTKRYGTQLVSDIQKLVIQAGEIVAFIGKNGSGKSTLLKMIAGLTYQTSGTIVSFGVSNQQKATHQLVKYVLESGRGYYDFLTAYENIQYFATLNDVHLSTPSHQTQLHTLCDVFQFTPHLSKKVSKLSQGNRQKLSLIVALLTDPQILCLDEPTNGLDLLSENQMIHQLQQLQQNGKTICVTTHDLYLLRQLNCRCILLKEGRIVRDEPANKLFGKDRVYSTYQLQFAKNLLPGLQTAIQQHNWTKEVVLQEEAVHIQLTTTDETIKQFFIQHFSFSHYQEEQATMEQLFSEVLQS